MNDAGPILARIVADKRLRAAERTAPLSEVRRAAEAAVPAPDVLPILHGHRQPAETGLPAVIAEFKRRSPSAGWLRQDGDPVVVSSAYADHGAVMASVLTDGPFFGGSLDDLIRVTAAGRLPALRKDFLLDEYDLCVTRAAGAAAALLIARLFPDRGELRALIGAAQTLGLAVLVEAHDVAEAVAAREAGAVLIGINHRDLDTLRIDLAVSAELRRALGTGPVLVAESGLRTGADLALMARRGMDAVLIGEALMKEADPGGALRRLLSDARAAQGGQ